MSKMLECCRINAPAHALKKHYPDGPGPEGIVSKHKASAGYEIAQQRDDSIARPKNEIDGSNGRS